jgi:hypothetical protein
LARPQKEGLDYFPHDVYAASDPKLEPILLLYGAKGYAFYFLHLEYIYRSSDLEFDISDAETREVIAQKLQISAEEYNQILESTLKKNLFDKKHFDETQKLTSNGIKKRASSVLEKREKMRLAYEQKISAAETTHIKKSKEKKSKEKKNINNMHGAINTPCQQPVITLLLNDKSEYPVVRSQVDEWKQLYPAVDVLQELRNMKGWLIANPTKRKTRRGILRFINSWLAREQDKGMQAPKSQLTKAPNKGNFDQRKYDDDYFDKLYKEV